TISTCLLSTCDTRLFRSLVRSFLPTFAKTALEVRARVPDLLGGECPCFFTVIVHNCVKFLLCVAGDGKIFLQHFRRSRVELPDQTIAFAGGHQASASVLRHMISGPAIASFEKFSKVMHARHPAF